MTRYLLVETLCVIKLVVRSYFSLSDKGYLARCWKKSTAGEVSSCSGCCISRNSYDTDLVVSIVGEIPLLLTGGLKRHTNSSRRNEKFLAKNLYFTTYSLEYKNTFNDS